MALIKDEKLFITLNLLEEPEPDYQEALIREGYLDGEYNLTAQAQQFIREFIAEKSGLIYESLKKQGRYTKDKGYVLLQAGLKKYLTAELIMEEMVKQRILKKKYQNEYIVRC